MSVGQSPFGGRTRGLLLPEQRGQRFHFEFEPVSTALRGVDARFEFALSDREDVGLHREFLALAVESLFRLTGLGVDATASVRERLQPETLDGVEHGFRETVQCGGAGVETACEAAPPFIEQRIDGVRGSAADL